MTAPLDIPALLDQLTLEEKASLTIGSDFWRTRAIERLGVPAVMVSDGPHGLRKQPAESDNVGLGGSIPATCFPTASAIGSSWDPDLVRRVGVALGLEARAEEIAVVLGPGVNMKRSPLCGRNFEYLSEDPHLAGVLGSAMVQGIQSQGVGTSVKHFAANNQETDRLRVSAEVDERTLREIYLPAFERIVTEAAPWTVMCAYNRLNGTYASEHRWLLTTVLREEWGFDGLVVSDWGAVHDRVAGVAAGLDLEMPPNLGLSDAAVVAAVESGALSEADLDTCVARVLQLVDRAQAGSGVAVGDWTHDRHHDLAAHVATQCAVLLKNEDAILPLTDDNVAVAVIGEFARTPRYQGAGSSQVVPTRVDSALDALRTTLGERVRFAAGFGIGTIEGDAALADEAVSVAAESDVVVVFLGLPAEDESEGYDREHMDLPANQVALLEQVAAVNSRTVVVLSNGSTIWTAPWERHAKAILEMWLSGQAGGGAVADLLLGVANPSGRLAETIPLRLQDSSSYLNFPGEAGIVRYGEGVFVGYRGYDAAQVPVSHEFGFGLSYTTFEYAGLTVEVSGSVETDDLVVAVSVDVRNSGERAGAEVVQVYVTDDDASVRRPERELRGFQKVTLDPGQTARVSVTLGARDLAYWSTVTGGWLVEPGEFTVAVGASSRDLRLTHSVHVDAPAELIPLGPMTTLQEFVDDPVGRAAVLAAVGTDEHGHLNGIFGDLQNLLMIGNFPISTFAGFPGGEFGNDQLQQILAAVPADRRA